MEKSWKEHRADARGLILEHMLLGDEVTKSGGTDLTLDDQLRGWDAMANRPGWGALELNLAIENIRKVLPPKLVDKPVGFGLLRTNGNNALLEEARSIGHKKLESPQLQAVS